VSRPPLFQLDRLRRFFHDLPGWGLELPGLPKESLLELFLLLPGTSMSSDIFRACAVSELAARVFPNSLPWDLPAFYQEAVPPPGDCLPLGLDLSISGHLSWGLLPFLPLLLSFFLRIRS